MLDYIKEPAGTVAVIEIQHRCSGSARPSSLIIGCHKATMLARTVWGGAWGKEEHHYADY